MNTTTSNAHHHALRRGRSSIPDQTYLITVCCRNRQPLLRETDAARAVARTLDIALHGQSSTMLAWVVMPDHFHLLLRLGSDDRLPAVMNRINSCAARAANAALSRVGRVWQGAYHDRAIRADEQLANVARYLVANPLRAGLVNRLGDYPYWNIEFSEANEALLDAT